MIIIPKNTGNAELDALFSSSKVVIQKNKLNSLENPRLATKCPVKSSISPPYFYVVAQIEVNLFDEEHELGNYGKGLCVKCKYPNEIENAFATD